MSPSEVFLVWWAGGSSCALLVASVQGAWTRFHWSVIVVSTLLWPCTPFLVAYVKKLDRGKR